MRRTSFWVIWLILTPYVILSRVWMSSCISGLHLRSYRSGGAGSTPPDGADIYVSQRDIVQMFERCINADASIQFDIFYGLSNNDLRWADIEDARKKSAISHRIEPRITTIMIMGNEARSHHAYPQRLYLVKR